MMNAIESAKAANEFFDEMFGDLPEEGRTNSDIMALVQLEKKLHMRQDIEVEFTKHRTGVTASFRAYHGINRVGAPEYAHITAIRLHRIQSGENILRKLRSDSRLYN